MSKLMMKSLIRPAALALALVGGVVAAHAHGHGMRGHEPGMMGPRMSMHLLDSVDASEAQRGQIKQIMDLVRQDMRASHESGRKLHAQMRDAMLGPQVDAAQLEVLRQQQLAQHDAMSRRMLQAMADAAKVLTPEQRAKLAERMKKAELRRAEHMKDRMKDGVHR